MTVPLGGSDYIIVEVIHVPLPRQTVHRRLRIRVVSIRPSVAVPVDLDPDRDALLADEDLTIALKVREILVRTSP